MSILQSESSHDTSPITRILDKITANLVASILATPTWGSTDGKTPGEKQVVYTEKIAWRLYQEALGITLGGHGYEIRPYRQMCEVIQHTDLIPTLVERLFDDHQIQSEILKKDDIGGIVGMKFTYIPKVTG